MLIFSKFPLVEKPVTSADLHEPPPVVPAVPARRDFRSAALVPGLEVVVSQLFDEVVVRVVGEATAASAGALHDGLLAAVNRRPAVVTLDLTELRCISSLALDVLATYRRDVVRWGGRVRLAGALQPAVHEALARTKLLYLFEISLKEPRNTSRSSPPV
jgi:anti-anti-sigma factor